MKNKIMNKIVASLMLTSMVFSNCMLTTLAMEDAGVIQNVNADKPLLRDDGDYSLKLKGDVEILM